MRQHLALAAAIALISSVNPGPVPGRAAPPADGITRTASAQEGVSQGVSPLPDRPAPSGTTAIPADSPIVTDSVISVVASQDLDAFRYDLIAFLAGVDATLPRGEATRRGSVGELTRAVAAAPGADIARLHGLLGSLVAAWSVVDATPPAPVSPPPMGPAAFTPDQAQQLEGLRARIVAYYDRLAPMAPYGETVSPAYADQLSQARSTVADMSLEDLDHFSQTLSEIPTWETVLDFDPAQVVGSAPLATLNPRQPGLNGAAVPLTHIHPQCADAAFGPVVTAVLAYLANTAEDLMDIWSNDFFIAVAGFGANAPNIPKIITLGIWLPLKLVSIAADFDSSIHFNCNEGYHQTLMADHDLSMIERTDLISSTLTAHDRDFTNRLDRVDSFQSNFETTLARLAAEKDLLRKGDRRISLFQIPASVCITTDEHQVCGMLETARDIVADTIQTGLALGLDMTGAQASYNDGVLQQGMGRYKAAYTRYREAYVLAVRAQ